MQLCLLLELVLAQLIRLSCNISCVTSPFDSSCSVRSLNPEPRNFFAEFFEVFGRQPILLEVFFRVWELVVLGVEEELPRGYTFAVKAFDLVPSVGHVVFELVLNAAGHAEVCCSHHTCPGVVLVLLLVDLKLFIGAK